jgi:hypothetical protein
MELLDFANASLVAGAHLEVSVFDVDQSPSMEDLNLCVPGIGKVFHSPVAGFWRTGFLTESGSGSKGRQLVRACLREW